MHPLMARIENRQDLDQDQARQLADGFFNGTLDEPAMQTALLAFNEKGVAVDELVGFAISMRTHSVAIHPNVAVTDTCGTGGDGAGTFNISTASAILVASCGVAVAKHGNRGQSSSTGSADVLETLGVPINLPPEQTQKRIESASFGFLFSPLYHPAMKRVAPVRKALGVKTIFNMLGPLTNPAKPASQVIGAYNLDAQDKMAQAASRLGIRRAFVVHSEGNDEAGLGRTRVLDVDGKKISESKIEPQHFGIQQSAKTLQVQDAQESAGKIRTALSEVTTLESRIVCLNAALALVAAGKAPDLQSGFLLAQESVQSGKTAEKLVQISEAAYA